MTPVEDVAVHRGHGRRARAAALGVLLAGLVLGGNVLAYDARSHQLLTFLAAKQLSRCLAADAGPHLSPLQVRGIANGTAALADTNFAVRMLRWAYYDPLEREGVSVAWLVSTRFNDHFRAQVAELEAAEQESDRLALLGRIAGYVQLVSSPARALPVYTARFWRWSVADRFDGYPIREAELEDLLDDDCSHLDSVPDSYETILAEVAAETLEAVRSPLGPLPATWEAFWTPPEEPGGFGSYGPAGNNFGRYTEFPCSVPELYRCVLITDDPAYTAFARDRQLAAVRGTARAMRLFLRGGGGQAPSGAAR
ncbi:MAG: hypothetical protein KF911_06415 [Pseudomonadales bacterium]|nr:hypothetical protein [Pseudomonadales bacterium]